LGGGEHSVPFAYALVVFYGIVGFLFGFLWSRIFLPGALRVGDLAALGAVAARAEEATKRVESTLERLRKQAELDALALSLAHNQLDPPQDVPPVAAQDLAAALKVASAAVKVHVFYQAQEVRRKSWKDPQAKPVMERTIPIFRALIASEGAERFHRNHSQLGYALKDQRTPDWAGAERCLTEAIEIRGSPDQGWRMYEFNRGICRIELDPAFRSGGASDAATRDRILEDLRVAMKDDALKKAICTEPLFARWLENNGLEIDDL